MGLPQLCDDRLQRLILMLWQHRPDDSRGHANLRLGRRFITIQLEPLTASADASKAYREQGLVKGATMPLRWIAVIGSEYDRRA